MVIMTAASRNLAALVAMRHWAGLCPGDAGWPISARAGREALSAAREMMTLTLSLTLPLTMTMTVLDLVCRWALSPRR